MQEVLVHDKLEQIIFVKDITYGVLYEQIRAQEKLKNMI